MNRKYTAEQIGWLSDNFPGTPLKEITRRFNERFGTDYTKPMIASAVYSRGIKNGIDCRFNKGWEPTQFKKGMIPWNKGKKWTNHPEACKATQFKAGHMPHNYKPVGTERIAEGYVWVKTADPKTWKEKHRLVYEQAYGPVPKGHAVIFADGNRFNFDPGNLIAVTRGQLARLNQNHLIAADADITRAGIAIADLITEAAEAKRRLRNSKRRKQK